MTDQVFMHRVDDTPQFRQDGSTLKGKNDQEMKESYITKMGAQLFVVCGVLLKLRTVWREN